MGQSEGYKAEHFDLKNLALFFCIAFGWTWFWWYLFISNVLKMPAGIGTPDVDLRTAGPILLIVILSSLDIVPSVTLSYERSNLLVTF